ncbi:MAG: DUF1192 domain-containing protein [Sneathiella sp.]
MTSEEDEKPILGGNPSNFAVMSVDELEGYITDLGAEIKKVQRVIEKKREAQNTAQSIFKS